MTAPKQNLIDDPWNMEMASRIDAIEAQYTVLRNTITDNTAITAATQVGLTTLRSDLSGVIKFSQHVETTQEIGSRLGAFAFWLAKISIAMGLFWAFIKYVVLEASRK